MTGEGAQEGFIKRWIHRAWWLHSFGALGFGVWVMLVARKGLAHADRLLLVLAAAWALVFVALRFIIVGRVTPDERLHKRGLRIVTNYIIKNLYQQMFFFQVPLYASSATWALDSPNMWLPILLLVCAVLSCIDTFFDNVVMVHRWLAASLFGICLLGLLNLVLPLVFGVPHARALMIAAVTAPAATALLSFSVRQVLSIGGIFWILAATVILVGTAWKVRIAIPPAPLSMSYGSVGHGTPGEYEVLPGELTRVRADQLDELRCGALVADPGGMKEHLVHVWKHDGVELARVIPEDLPTDEPNARATRSRLPELPQDPLGKWRCVVMTADGQLVGRVSFEVIPAAAAAPPPAAPADAGP